MALYWPVPGTWSCPSGTDLLQHLCRRQDNFLLRKKGKHGYFLLFTPPCVDSFYIAGDFSTNDKMIPQSIPLKHKRFIIREWRPPTWDLSQEGIWKGNRHGANQTPPWRKEDVWQQKQHPLTYTSTDSGTMGLFHQNYCTNQHNIRNKLLAGFKVIFW